MGHLDKTYFLLFASSNSDCNSLVFFKNIFKKHRKVHFTWRTVTICLPLLLDRLSLIEPGPVVTEFERKVFEDGMKMDLSAADEETADMFTNIYLKNYKQIFQSLGQSAEEVAEVTQQFLFFFLT